MRLYLSGVDPEGRAKLQAAGIAVHQERDGITGGWRYSVDFRHLPAVVAVYHGRPITTEEVS